MILEEIKVFSWRNVREAKVSFSPSTTVLLGNNAQGKTNLVEAVYLLACAKSFRTPRYRDLIFHGEKEAGICGTVSGEGLPFELKMSLSDKEGKSIYKNGVRLQKLSDFLGLFRVVLFCPEHLSLIKDGPGKRRSFIDSAICQLRPYYASLLNECNKIEAQRGALLKQSVKKSLPRDLFYPWDERLAQVSVKIASIRADYVRRLSLYAPGHFQGISGGKETLSLLYESDVYREDLTDREMQERYLETLSQSFALDQKYGFTAKGIHRDDLNLCIDAFPARGFASQGQQRSAVLALKLAEGEISREMTGKSPVYLLDDVLSELDRERREYITANLSGKQIIFTGTEEKDFSFVDRVIRVEKGEFFR